MPDNNEESSIRDMVKLTVNYLTSIYNLCIAIDTKPVLVGMGDEVDHIENALNMLAYTLAESSEFRSMVREMTLEKLAAVEDGMVCE